MAAPLILFNSLSRALERFAPIDPAMVRVYSCGPTVYSRQHLGNMRAYIFTDTLRRVLEYKGWPVSHVINITDVGHLTSDADAGDDKVERAAARERLSAWDLAARYTDLFKQDLARLNVREPTRWSVATDHIADMIAFAERIGASTYELPSGLYFDTASVPDYGRLAGHRGDDGAAEVSRIETVEGKRNPADFAIWRRSEEPGKRQMEWPSPWGVGAPGWHLECSVMSIKYLGPQFDIHTGGIDHREIHHPNEIAQNQAFTRSAETGANVWMHNNFLVERGEKMAKSSGGFATLDTLVDAGIHPLAYRLLCLSAHYRSELEFSLANVAAALTRLKRLVIGVSHLRNSGDPEHDDQTFLVDPENPEFADAKSNDLMRAFDAALSDDLNTPKALVLLEQAFSGEVGDRLRLVRAMDQVLGLGLAELARSALRLTPSSATLTPEEIEARLRERKIARAAKDFATSDRIRDELKAAGVELMDGDPLGWEWVIRL